MILPGTAPRKEHCTFTHRGNRFILLHSAAQPCKQKSELAPFSPDTIYPLLKFRAVWESLGNRRRVPKPVERGEKLSSKLRTKRGSR